MNKFIANITKVLDNFVIEFEAPGIVDKGKAIPLYTIMEPKTTEESGMEALIIPGDDLLHSLYFYILVKATTPVLYAALGNYLQFSEEGLNLVSEKDVLIKASNKSVIKGESGSGIDGKGGKVMIKNDSADLKDLLSQIAQFLSGLASNCSAAGYPVALLPPGVQAVQKINTTINNLLGKVEAAEISDGGVYNPSGGSSSGSSSSSSGEGSGDSGDSESSVSPEEFSGNKAPDVLKDLISALKNLCNALNSASYIVTGTCAGSLGAGTIAGTATLPTVATSAITELEKVNAKLEGISKN